MALTDGLQVIVKAAVLAMTSTAPNLDVWKTYSSCLALPWKLCLYLSPHIWMSNIYTEPCPIIRETWYLAKITEGKITLASTSR